MYKEELMTLAYTKKSFDKEELEWAISLMEKEDMYLLVILPLVK